MFGRGRLFRRDRCDSAWEADGTDAVSMSTRKLEIADMDDRNGMQGSFQLPGTPRAAPHRNRPLASDRRGAQPKAGRKE